MSGLEYSEQQVVRAQLEYERSELHKELRELIEGFDRQVAVLREEKFRVESKAKWVDLHRLVLNQEWALLKEFEKRELVLMSKLHAKEEEHSEVGRKKGFFVSCAHSGRF